MNQSTTGTRSSQSRGPGAHQSCMVSLDRSLRIVAANQEMFRRFRQQLHEDLCGSAFCDLLDPSVRTAVHGRLQRLLDGQQSRSKDTTVTLQSPEGQLQGELTATPFARGAGRIEGVIAVLAPHAERGAQVPRPRRILSDMDAKILEGVASGASTVQLASTLFLSRGGVEYHVTSLLRRMKVKNRPALISKAYALGMFEMGSWPPQVVADHVK